MNITQFAQLTQIISNIELELFNSKNEFDRKKLTHLAEIRGSVLSFYLQAHATTDNEKSASKRIPLNDSLEDNRRPLQYKYTVEVPDEQYGGNKLYTFSSSQEAETCAAQANGLAGLNDKSPNLIRAVKKLISE